MSCSYYVLCVSHDPALEVASGDAGRVWNRAEQALAAVANRNDSRALAEHRGCDLVVIGNYYNTYYCPPNPRCDHTGTETINEPWIGLMKAAIRSDDDAVKAHLDRFTGCWTAERIRRIAGYFEGDQ